MPSSISSSSDRVPRLPGGRMWAMAVILAVVFCAGAETFWRARGHRPSIVDDPDWWAFHRGKVYARGNKAVVLAGLSRNQLGFSTDAFRKRFPDYEVVQLAINGRYPLQVLRDLANDPEFKGLVLCSTEHSGVVGESDLQEYLDAYHRSPSANSTLNRLITSWLQSNLVFINPQVRTDKTTRAVLTDGELPKPLYLIMNYDRSRCADYTMTDIKKWRRKLMNWVLNNPVEGATLNKTDWCKRIADAEALVDRIQARGGNVVFVVFPVTDVSLSVPEQHNPKNEFWDRFARTTKGIPIHFLDVPALRVFDCPDTSHLDQRDSPKYTNALLDELVRRGVLRNEGVGSVH